MHKLSLHELRQIWAKTWGLKPHARIGQTMLEKSLAFKRQNHLTKNQDDQLERLIKQYKRNPTCFDNNILLKPGTQLVRVWKGKRHNVFVKTEGFEYQDRIYSSLSQIANDITGSKWNGNIFFGLKKAS